MTPESVYLNRRSFISAAAGAAAATAASVSVPALALPSGYVARRGFSKDVLGDREEITPEQFATSYNNFYEFGTDKSDPAAHAHQLTTDPWSIEVSGEVGKPGKIGLEDMISDIPLEERIYRLRCVEAWSMVIPWIGFSLKRVLDKFEPKGSAKYVKFTTLERPSEMPGQGSFFSSIKWPYVEGLRLDEANHHLTMLAVGMYGKDLPKQNGAPVRLVVPWKYGFKSIKSIVKIELTAHRPRSTWMRSAPNEYGFYANVNPAVSHPRWSQAQERRLPSTFLSPNKIPTQPFNGYGDAVASLYAGMDLKRNF